MVFQKASAWLFMPQPKGLFVTLSSPRKASQSQTFPIYEEIKQPGSGKQWESLEQAAPLVAESFPHPRRSSNLSRWLLLWLLLSRLLLCSCPAAQPRPCSHPRHLSFGTQTDLLTCEQLLLKNRYPPFQRAKSLGQLGKTGKGHRLNLVLLCAPCGSSHEEAGGMRWGLGTRSWCLCMLETISISKPDTHCLCCCICDPHSAIFLPFPVLSLLPYSVCQWAQPLNWLSSKEGIMLGHRFSYCSFLQPISIMIGKKPGSHHLCFFMTFGWLWSYYS